MACSLPGIRAGSSERSRSSQGCEIPQHIPGRSGAKQGDADIFVEERCLNREKSWVDLG
jgi:hypothetical protein